MTALEKYIQTYFGVIAVDAAKISTYFTPTAYKKGDYFLKSGRLCHTLGFIQSGIFREYLTINDKEVTKWIATEGYFVVDLSSFLFQQTAQWNIQALTDSEVYTIDYTVYKKIGDIIPSWVQLEKLFIAKCFGILESRILQHLALSAEQRYQQLLEHNASLFNQVPLQYLASMLGMSAETLSRLRKKASA